MEDLKKQIEAIIFSVGKKISCEKIALLCKTEDIKLIEKYLNEIRKDYNENSSPMILIQEGQDWKLTVRGDYLHLVRNIVTDTELSKSITQTLAIIAFKYPVSQAEIVKIRSNKAYGHIKKLQQSQFIEKVRNGRTYDIKLTPKFFEYFDLPEETLKKTFGNYKEVEKIIEGKEKEFEETTKVIKEKNLELQKRLKEKQGKEEDYLKDLDEMTPDFEENVK